MTLYEARRVCCAPPAPQSRCLHSGIPPGSCVTRSAAAAVQAHRRPAAGQLLHCPLPASQAQAAQPCSLPSNAGAPPGRPSAVCWQRPSRAAALRSPLCSEHGVCMACMGRSTPSLEASWQLSVSLMRAATASVGQHGRSRRSGARGELPAGRQPLRGGRPVRFQVRGPGHCIVGHWRAGAQTQGLLGHDTGGSGGSWQLWSSQV